MTTVHTRDAHFQIKAAGESDGLKEGQIDAYASIFGNVDSYGDIVAQGAFTKTLAAWAESGRVIPLLYGHNMTDPNYNIGGIDHAVEDEKGLRVRASFDLDNPTAAQVYRLIKGRRLNELSFAFGVVSSTDEGNNRILDELDLYEVSIVVLGANPATEIVAVKSAIKGLQAGRALEAKNAESLREAQSAMKSAIENIEAVLTTETTRSSSDEDTPAGKSKIAEPVPLEAEHIFEFL